MNKNSACYKCTHGLQEGYPHPLSVEKRFVEVDCPFLEMRRGLVPSFADRSLGEKFVQKILDEQFHEMRLPNGWPVL